MVGFSVLVRQNGWLPSGASTLIGWMPGKLGSRWIADRGARVTVRVLEDAGLPPFLETVMRPWVTAIETGTLGMRDEVAAAASGTAASLKRRVVVLPALDVAIAEAVAASVVFADALGTRGTGTARARTAALAKLEVVIEQLRTAEPSADTRALGLGW